MKIYLLRHSQRGHCEKQDSLTEIGKEQARRTADFFKTIKLDKIICGYKNRTKETLKPILRYQECSVEYTQDVNEQELGIFEGKSDREFKEAIENSGLSKDEFRPEGGENREDAYERAKIFCEKLKKENAKNLLIVSHAGFISDLIMLFLSLPEEENVHFKTGFCAISYFDLDENFKLKDFSIGELKHLAHYSKENEKIKEL
ncbi:MAG: alpha-ribazole phosphatase [Candidatus Woesearchaeota archaeon]|nr:alpha-ribazole phosphatase [Candidatus Woesearchaeota archaeon]